MNNQSVKRYPLSKQVSDQLEQMIESGQYEVGQRIPTEPELMEMFSVSRNTIREAIKSLTWSGVLEVKQGDGTYVRATNRFHANMKQKYAQVSLEDIAEARNAMEITISYLAALRRTDEDMEKITQAYTRRKGLKDTVKENTEADVDFHMSIAQACQNVILTDLYSSISDYLEDHISKRHMESGLDFDEIDALHEKLYLAVRNKNAPEAAASAQNILKI